MQLHEQLQYFGSRYAEKAELKWKRALCIMEADSGADSVEHGGGGVSCPQLQMAGHGGHRE